MDASIPPPPRLWQLRRLGARIAQLVFWVIPAAFDAFSDEPESILTGRDIVATLLFSLGWVLTPLTPILMYLYDIGTTPWRVAAGVGVYLAFGIVYTLHDEYAVYRF